jgi:hypothetical protein
VGLMLPACGATRIAIGNGQPIFLALVPVVAATFWLYRGEAETRLGRVRAFVAFLAGLVKPHLTVPVYAAAAVAPSRRRVLIWVGLAYVAVTLFAVAFQPTAPDETMLHWLRRVRGASGSAAYAGSGPGVNVHAILVGKDLAYVRLAISFAILGAFAVWTYFYRHTNVVLQLGIGAAVARMWTYHRAYDDVLMILPAIALFRLAKFGPGGRSRRIVAGALLTLLLGSLVGLRVLDPLHEAVGLIWPSVLVYLLVEAHLEKRAARETRSVVEPAEALA